MNHCRVIVNGTEEAVAAAVAELAARSEAMSTLEHGRCFVLATSDGLPEWTALTSRHPAVILGVECFEEFGDEYLHAVISGGQVTVMAEQELLPHDWGSFHDEDGVPLEPAPLRRAAESVAQQRLKHDIVDVEHGVDVALTIGEALGRLCLRVERPVVGGPSREALDSVIELAVIALWIGASGRSTGVADRDFEHALRLTRSMLHAGMSDIGERPGDASWVEWLQVLIGAASGVIDAGCEGWCVADSDDRAVAAEQYGTATEQLDGAAGSLLTTCLQALALFNAPREESWHS